MRADYSVVVGSGRERSVVAPEDVRTIPMNPVAAVAVEELHGVRQKESDLENNSADEADNGSLWGTEEGAESTSSSDGDWPRHNDAVRNF